MSDAEGLVLGSPFKSCLGRRPKANAAKIGGGIPTEPLALQSRLSATVTALLFPWRQQRCFQSSQWW